MVKIKKKSWTTKNRKKARRRSNTNGRKINDQLKPKKWADIRGKKKKSSRTKKMRQQIVAL